MVFLLWRIYDLTYVIKVGIITKNKYVTQHITLNSIFKHLQVC